MDNILTAYRKYFHFSTILFVRLCVVVTALISYGVSAYPIGLKMIQSFPETPLATAKSWSIATFGASWAFFATEDGLIQYDSATVKIFPLKNNNSVRSVNVDPAKQRIYAGGINEFGYFRPNPDNSLEYVCLSDSVGQDRYIGNIWGIYHNNGSILAQGDMAILVFDEQTGAHSIIPCRYKLDCSNMIDEVLWLGTDDGLKFLMGKTVVEAQGATELRGMRIRAILPFGDVLLIVTAGNGVYRYDRSVLTRLEAASNASTRLGEVFSAAIFDNVLALGSIDNGVGVVDLTSGTTQIYNESSGLSNNTVLSLSFDEEGDLWTGLDVGTCRIMLQLPVETFNNNTLPIGSGYVLATVGERMYLGTNRGLFYVDYFPGTDLSRASFRQVEGLKGQVWGLVESHGGIFCCHDRGLFFIKDGKISKIDCIKGAWDVQHFKNDPEKAYVGTYFGLQVIEYSDGRWIFKKGVDGYGGSCYNFVQESPTRLWSNDGEGGIYRLLVDTASFKVEKLYNFKETVDGVALNTHVSISRIDNDIYFCTSNGICRYDGRKGVITRDETMSVLIGSPSNVQRIIKIGNWLYALTDKEIIKSDADGILGISRRTFPGSHMRPMHDGNVMFPVAPDYIAYPTKNGYEFFDFSDNVKEYESPSPLARINRVSVTAMKDSTIFEGNFMDIKPHLHLKYHENSIRIEFGSPFQSARGVVYSSRLNDGKWSAPATANIKEFTGLKEGDYVFEIRAQAPDGKESVDSISFKVLPPWWRSIWAICVYALLASCVVAGCVWLERRRVRRKQEAIMIEKNAELARQQADFEWESKLKDHKIIELEKEQLDKELRHKAQEMTNVMMSLAHKNETLQTVKRELQNIQQSLPKTATDARRAILELQGKVSVDIKSDEVLKRVEEEFDLVHNDFIKKLRGSYPDLSNNEVLMCAYLKMRLSTKEIAPLLNISIRGVETMRYRIRKKFGLERDDSLTEFLERN